MDIYFVTFADRKYSKTLERIRKEALSLDIFKDIFAWNESNLNQEWWTRHSSFIRKSRRGFGYWIWKPQVIQQVLGIVPEGSIVLYCDAGCSLNARAKDKIKELANQVSNHPSQVLAFELGFVESDYTKMDVMNALHYQDYGSRQIQAGISFWYNAQHAQEFVDAWKTMCTKDNYHFVDDSASVAPNAKGFKDHRHDQSIFSVLMKQRHGKLIPKWPNNEHYPIHTLRLKF